jgi:cation diffusion facilitator family transporter
MSTEGSTRAILAALLANAGIAVAKFVGYLITGSSSMLAESVHSVADTSNQGLLLFGQREARKEADPLHQFGYGRSRYFYSFVVALVLFTLGSVFALYEGLPQDFHPEDPTSPMVAIVILVVAIGLKVQLSTAIVESRPLRPQLVAVRPQLPQPGAAGGAAGGHRRPRRTGLRAGRRRPDGAHR